MANSYRSPAFTYALHALEKDDKSWQKIGLTPLKTPDQSLDAFIVLNDRNHDGLGDAFNVRSSENAVNDWIHIHGNYKLVVLSLINSKDTSTGLLLIPNEYTFSDMSMAIEIALAFELGGNLVDKRPNLEFPQLDKSWMDCAHSDELKTSTTVKDFCRRYAYPGDPVNELVIKTRTPFDKLDKSKASQVAAAREYFLSLNAKPFLDVNTTGKMHLAVPSQTFLGKKAPIDKLRADWNEFTNTTKFPAARVEVPILTCFSTSELEKAAVQLRNEPKTGQHSLPIIKLVKRQAAFNKMTRLRKKPADYENQNELAKEFAAGTWRSISPDKSTFDTLDEMPVFVQTANICRLDEKLYSRLEYECKYIFETVWKWISSIKRNKYKVPHDILPFDKSYKFFGSTAKKVDMETATSPPAAFKPVRGTGRMIYVITTVYPEVEIVPVPEEINLDTVTELRRSFKNLCRISFAFNMPSDFEDPIGVLKLAFDDNVVDTPRAERAYRSFWQHLTSLLGDADDAIIISTHKIRSDTQKRIAKNLAKSLDQMGATRENDRRDLLYSRFKYVYGYQKFDMFAKIAVMPPQVNPDKSVIARNFPHVVEEKTILFDEGKTDLSTNDNVCKVVGCAENAGPFITCEYHLQMIALLTENYCFTSAVRSTKSDKERFYTTLDRFNIFSSWSQANNKSRARLMLDIVTLMRDKSSPHTPKELVEAIKRRVGTGVKNTTWECLAEKSDLSKVLKEMVACFNELRKTHNWVQVNDKSCGEFISVTTKDKPGDVVRHYSDLTFVRKQKSTLVKTSEGQQSTGNPKEETELDNFFADLDHKAVWDEFLRKIEHDELLEEEIGASVVPLELTFLHDKSIMLDCKLVIFATENNFDSLCEAFAVGDHASPDQSNTRYNNVVILKQTEVEHDGVTFKRVVRANAKGCVSAVKPVYFASVGRAYPPKWQSMSRSWIYTASFVLSEDPAPGLFAENLAGIMAQNDPYRKSIYRTAKRELHTFWTSRFLFFMQENKQLQEVGLVYGDVGLLTTPKDLPGPNDYDLSKLRSRESATKANIQADYRKRVGKETRHFPFGNDLQEYGKHSLVSPDMSETVLNTMATFWLAYELTRTGSIDHATFKNLWTLEGCDRDSSAFEAAADRFDRSQELRKRQDKFEVASGLRNELRARADAENEAETIFSDAIISDSDMSSWENDPSPLFPLVNAEQVLQVAALQVEDGADDDADSMDSIIEVPIPIDHVLEEINFQHESDTEAGQIPDLSNVVNPPPTQLQLDFQELQIRAKLARDQLVADNIRPGGKWDPKDIGLVKEESDDMAKAREILKALGEARMKKNNETGQNDDNVDKNIIDKFSKHLKLEKIVPDVSKLAKKTKCSVRCIADNVAKLNLSGAEPRETPVDQSAEAKDFFHRADLAPNPTARAHLASMGVEYNESCLIEAANIKIEYDIETRQLIKRAALVACEDRKNDQSAPEEHAIHAILFLTELLLLDSCQLTQYLACITVINGELDASKLRRLLHGALKATKRLGQVKKWAIHFIPNGQDEY
ncbi:unnamed protein product [Oikopleura dioica]|uniref:Uncharacterized protein n=1 Tax=Oikopleura dioica TaxID=34765 RepID=E4XYR7_OIKDI|nr:unnamed protein product [Oikopleura dioica]